MENEKYEVRIVGTARGILITRTTLEAAGHKVISTEEVKPDVWECVAEVYP